MFPKNPGELEWDQGFLCWAASNNTWWIQQQNYKLQFIYKVKESQSICKFISNFKNLWSYKQKLDIAMLTSDRGDFKKYY